MSPSAPSRTLHTAAFAGAPGGAWGAAWFPSGDAPGLLVIAQGGEIQVHEARLELADSSGPWRVDSDAGALTIAPLSDPIDLSEGEHAPVGFDQRCRASGRALDDATALARRGQRDVDGALSGYDSIREVSAWLAEEEAVTVIALRPRRHRGHEGDEIAAAVSAGEPWGPVIDPRLSTTYGAAGEPARVGLELWSADADQYPRRYAAEVLAPVARASGAGWELQVAALRCHGRGDDGSGIYLLARPA